MSNVSDLTLSQPTTLDQWFSHQDINAALATQYANMQKVAALVTTTRIGQANMAFDAVTEPDAQVGHPLFYNTVNQRFERSQLDLLLTPGGRTYATPASEAWALLVKKCDDERAHLLLSGLATVSLLESAGVASPAGKFYLSRDIGVLVDTPDHSLVVPVLFATGSGEVLFRPWFADTFPRYVPSFVDLVTGPAGVSALSAGKLVINSPNPAQSGWLPAGHASFGGTAPIGARFGYNISQDPNLSDSWPPLIPKNSKIYLEAGGTTSAGARVLLNDPTRVLINQDGIWWMNDCPNQTPWSYAVEGAGVGPCPFPQVRRMTLETDFALYGADQPGGVTNLNSQVPWLQLVEQNTSNPATIGDLSIMLRADQLFDPVLSDHHLGFKELVGGKVKLGPVTGSVKSLSPALVISGGTQVSEDGRRSGDIDLSVSASRDFDLLPIDTQLFSATTEAYGDLMSIGLPPGYRSWFVNSYHVPSSITPDSNLRFYFWITGQTTYQMPSDLELSVKIFPTPSGGNAVVLPAKVPLVLDYTPGQTIQNGQYRQYSADLVEVAGGNMVYLELLRNGDTDGVASELHVLKQFGKFEL